MRRLLLLRHAKAERARPGERDHDRILADRGRADTPKIAHYMARHGLVPDAAVVSTAARTRETWALCEPVFERAPPVVFESRIYEATPQAIMGVIAETAPGVGTLLVIGHNPGLQELAALLIASGDVDARQRMNEGFPTSALAVIGFAFEDWSGVHPHAGRLEHFVTPRALEPESD
ncbi:MAG: histidine phosphatase family protein [Alphaproteobacteria bacterium]|nr:histidine phosphatase family protein [Alphaproteobacteria bacterium]